MYIVVSSVNTKAWISATAISSPVIATTIANGSVPNTAISPPVNNIFHANPDNIASNKCPAVIFAANRTPNVIALIE